MGKKLLHVTHREQRLQRVVTHFQMENAPVSLGLMRHFSVFVLVLQPQLYWFGSLSLHSSTLFLAKAGSCFLGGNGSNEPIDHYSECLASDGSDLLVNMVEVEVDISFRNWWRRVNIAVSAKDCDKFTSKS